MSAAPVLLGRRLAPSGGASVRADGLVEIEADRGLVILAQAERLSAAEDEAAAPDGLLEAAARLAVEQVRQQIRLHEDSFERFRLQPSPGLTSRIQGLVREGLIQASKEVYALGWRREQRLAVHLDLALLLPDEVLVAHAGRGQVVLLHESLAHRLTGRQRILSEEPPAGGGELFGRVEEEPTQPLGSSGEAPVVEVLSVSTEPGDRLILLGAGLAEGASRLVGAMELPEPARALERLLSAPLPSGVAGLVALAQPGEGPRASQDRLALLRGIHIFRWCTDEELRSLAGLAEPRRIREGELLLRQDSLNTTLYLLVRGRVSIRKDGQEIAEATEGAVFGEMSMLDEPRASATVRAETDGEVLTIQRADFLAALKSNAPMAVKVLWSLLLSVSANLRATSRRLADQSARSVGAPDGGS